MKQVLLLLNICLLFASFGQEEHHSCALKHESIGHATKNLTVQEEMKANKYDVHYIELDLAMSNQNTNVSGTAVIHGNVIADMDSIILELFPTLVISDLRLNAVSTVYDRFNSVLKVPINATAGQSFILEVDYAGTPPNPSTNPFGGSGVTNSYVSDITDRVTWTVSCPFLAHEWFPCKQVLRDKVDSSAIHITVPTGITAASNGILENTIDLGNGSTRFEWKNNRPILYYLICVTIAPYVEYNLSAYPAQLGGGAVDIQNFVYGSATNLPLAVAQCDLLPGYLELFSDLFGLYPFHEQKYGQCTAPLGGGMEHQTMTTLGVNDKKITAHELSHQWWGDHVGIASFSDVWLSEGFASYSEILMLQNLFPSEAVSLMNSWHNTVKSSPSGSVWFTDTTNIPRIYNSRLTYKKGAAILHTLRHIVNNDALFFQTLQDFQVDFADSVAVGLDIKNAFEASTGLDLTNFFEEWYFGEGFPTYTSRWNSIGNDLLIEISHTTSWSAVTPTFTNPLEIKFSRFEQGDTTIRFDITDNLDQFYLPNIGQVIGVISIDPNNWIVNNFSPSLYDPTFTAGISDLKNNEVSVFPNPSTGNATITMERPGNYTVKVMSSKGELVDELEFHNTANLDLGDHQKGTYILEILSAGNEHVTRKLIKY
jgi:aminopeptidase N